MNSFKKGTFASLLLVIEQTAIKLVGLISTLILARLLMPEDFGIIAIAMLVIGFVEILTQTGAAQYLLRVEELNDDKINTAWTIDLILKSITTFVMIGSGIWASEYYDDDRLAYIITALALIFAAYILNNPGLAYLRRAQEYGKIVKLTVFTKILVVIATVAAAFTFQNYWALIIGKAVGALSMIIGSNIIYPFKRRLLLTNAKAQWQFSGWMIPQAIFGYIRAQLDTFLVSSNFGQAALGSYHTIKYIAYIPSENFLTPLSKPFLVELTKAKIDRNYFNKQYNASYILIMLIAAPIVSIMYLYSELVTLFILGPNWLEYAYLFGIFSLLIPTYVTLEHASRLLILYGKTKQIFLYQCLAFFCIYTPLVIIGISDLKLFSLIRVGAEAVMSLGLLLTVSVIYTGWKNAAKLAFSFIPISVAISIAALTASHLAISNINVFVDLSIVTLIFSLSFILSLLAFYLLFLHKFNDWNYLASLILRILSPILKKINQRNR